MGKHLISCRSPCRGQPGSLREGSLMKGRLNPAVVSIGAGSRFPPSKTGWQQKGLAQEEFSIHPEVFSTIFFFLVAK